MADFEKNAWKKLSEINCIKLELVAQIQNTMIVKFKSVEAGEFWVNSFSNKDQVSRKNFISKFKEIYEKLQLKKSDVDKIIEKIDEDKDLLIRYDEWDKFCVSIWSNK